MTESHLDSLSSIDVIKKLSLECVASSSSSGHLVAFLYAQVSSDDYLLHTALHIVEIYVETVSCYWLMVKHADKIKHSPTIPVDLIIHHFKHHPDMLLI